MENQREIETEPPGFQELKFKVTLPRNFTTFYLPNLLVT